ncbi:hypothetical protein SAMD00019534_081540, partial [Acytostelium subglobosum LB1]|uniref:hypothetical protein n=1 Tax=Acytostelium subglobosum LB1 TaxID=1410327 RepID=UPI000644DBFE
MERPDQESAIIHYIANSIRKPLQLPSVVECLYSLQRIPIPHDLYFLLTNNRTCRPTSPDCYDSNSPSLALAKATSPLMHGAPIIIERRKTLVQHRNSSYSDHVAITRGLVQINRSPRTSPEKNEENGHSNNKLDKKMSAFDMIKDDSSGQDMAPTMSGSSTPQTNSNNSSMCSSPLTASSDSAFSPNSSPKFQLPMLDDGDVSVAMSSRSKSDRDRGSPVINSTAIRSPNHSPSIQALQSPSIMSVARRLSIPLLDLDSSQKEFIRKSQRGSHLEREFVENSPRGGTAGSLLNKSEFKVLLVEDNLVNVKVFTKMLKDAGYRVDVAWNGKQGVEASAKQYYPIIFMDCTMPDMDGYQATELIRGRENMVMLTDKRYKRSFVIALTANVTPSDREKCFDVGMDDFIQKPLRSSSVLVAMIDKYLKYFTDDDLYYLGNIGRGGSGGVPPSGSMIGTNCH